MRPKPSLLATLFAEAPRGGHAWRTGALLAVCFSAAYFAVGYVQFYHWNIANGLLFTALWMLPRRWWPWLFAATILARTAFLSLIHI